jgi:exosome complex exonuclease DIS3/RRP44
MEDEDLAAFEREMEMEDDTPGAAAAAAAAGLGPGSASTAAAGSSGSSARHPHQQQQQQRSSKRKKLYAVHKTAAEVAAGVAAGRLHQGALRCSRFNPFEGYVKSDSVGQDIRVSGRVDMNRAMDGELRA